MITDYDSSVRICLSDLLLSRYIPWHFLDCSGARRVAPSVRVFVVLLVCTSSGGFMAESLLVRFGPFLKDFRLEQFNENMWTIRVVLWWDPIIFDPVVRLTDCHFLVIYIPQQEIDTSPGQWSAQSIKLSSMSVQSQWTITGPFIPSSLCLDQIKWTFAKYFLSRGLARWRQYCLGPEESWKWN